MIDPASAGDAECDDVPTGLTCEELTEFEVVIVLGKLPVGEMFGLSSELRSATGGRFFSARSSTVTASVAISS